MFTYFTDRDGKYQLGTLKESAFDPLSRTCEFMLKEEAHHMLVGTTGVDRVVERTAQLMVEHDTDDVAGARRHPARRDPEVPELPLLGVARPVRRRDLDQRRQLLHRRAQGPLDGGPAQGRPPADRRRDRWSTRWSTATIGQTEVSALVGLNTDLRREYIADCQSGVKRWNRILEQRRAAAAAGAAARRRSTARSARSPASRRPRTGELLTGRGVGAPSKGRWLPTEVDKTHVRSLMQPVHERGKIAAWIAPPRQGINGKPFDYDYVHLA